MSSQISTIVIRVDLDYDKCYKKIRKVLCKIQDRASIKTISYDEKSKTVTVSGPFDAEEVADRLCSDAGKVITDIHVVGGNQMKPGAKEPKPGHGGHGDHGGGKPEKIKQGGYGGHGDQGGYGGGGKPEKIKQGGHGDYGGHGGGKPEKAKHGDHGGKPEKVKHVKFDVDDDDDDEFEFDKHGHHANNGKPKVVTTTAMSRMEAPRAEPPVSMSAMAPMRMPAQTPMMKPQAMATPSIWPAAPEWGYSAPAYGGYYGGPPMYDRGGYAPPPPYGYGRNPYQQQYYDEEPSAACSIM